MSDVRHRKAIRAALISARGLAGNLTKRRGMLPDITPEELDAFADGVRGLCALLECVMPDTVRAAKDAVLAEKGNWLAGNALVTILNQEAQRRGVDPYRTHTQPERKQ